MVNTSLSCVSTVSDVTFALHHTRNHLFRAQGRGSFCTLGGPTES